MPPMTKKGTRQPKPIASGTIISGARAEPAWDPVPSQDIARPVSPSGNHREMTAELLGNAPDSPIPNKKRTSNKEINPLTSPVIAVNKDQSSTILIKTALGPIL